MHKDLFDVVKALEIEYNMFNIYFLRLISLTAMSAWMSGDCRRKIDLSINL